MNEPQHPFKKFIELASKPLPSNKEARQLDNGYTDTQTLLRKVENTSAQPSDKSRPNSASTETKDPQ